MSLFGFLQFSLGFCFDFLAWPLIALAYPLCASIRAIETNSISNTQKLNTYWMVLSLILLLELALVKLLEWIPFWPYIRLMVVCCLVIPYFDGAFFVYKHLIRPRLYMDSRSVIWLEKPNDPLLAEEKILAEVKTNVMENGPEAMENAGSCKLDREKGSHDSKAIERVSSKENKMLEESNSSTISVQKDIKAVEVMEKNEVVSSVNQVGQVSFYVEKTKNRNFAAAQIEGTRTELPKTSEPGILQKEWKCAICHVTTQSWITLNSHLQGKKHKLKAENQTILPKNFPQSILEKSSLPTEEPAKRVSCNRSSTAGVKNSYLWCTICNISCTGAKMASHLKSQNHLAQVTPGTAPGWKNVVRFTRA